MKGNVLGREQPSRLSIDEVLVKRVDVLGLCQVAVEVGPSSRLKLWSTVVSRRHFMVLKFLNGVLSFVVDLNTMFLD